MNNTRNVRSIYIFLLLIVCSLFMAGIVAAASKENSLSERFQQATTISRPGTFEAMGRTVHHGGYLRTRFETRAPLNPVRLQGPGMSGGCNGFDIYGGSFSYISGDEILEWLKAVTENAGALATYMFLTYLQEQCSVCSEVMQALYAMQDLINTTMGGSCETATAMVGGLMSMRTNEESPEWEQYKHNLTSAARKASDGLSTAYNAGKDALSALKDVQSDPNRALDNLYIDEEKKIKEAHGGNMLYWVINDGGSRLLAGMRQVAGNNLDEESLYTYLSFYVGNMIRHSKAVDDKGSNTPAPVELDTQRQMTIARMMAHDYLDDIVTGGNCNGAFSENENYCLDPTDTTFRTGYLGGGNLISFTDHFSCMMTGTAPSGCSSPGLINILGSTDSTTPDLQEGSDELSFLTTFSPGMPYGGMLYELRTSPGAMQSFYNCTKDKIAIEFAYSQILHALQAVRNGLTITKDVSKDHVDRYRHYLNLQIVELNEEYGRMIREVDTQSCQSWEIFNTFRDVIKGHGTGIQ